MNTLRTFIKNRHEQGFSLVEMAIVLVIIGLIVSAIAVGKTTMRKGEATKTYQQFINPWIQLSLNQYQNDGSLDVEDSGTDLLSKYNYGGSVITKSKNEFKAGILIIPFAISPALTKETHAELKAVNSNALATALSAITTETEITVKFNVPQVNQNPANTKTGS